MSTAGVELVTLNEFKSFVKVKSTNNDLDLILGIILNGVADKILETLDHRFIVQLREQLFDVPRGMFTFATPAFPIHAIVNIYSDYDRLFPTSSIIAPEDYSWERKRDIGIINIDKAMPETGHGSLKVDYVGGHAFDRDIYLARQDTPPGAPNTGDTYLTGATPTGAWAALPNQLATWDGVAWQFVTAYQQAAITYPQLKLAILQQASYEFRTKDLQGTQQATFKNASIMVRPQGFISPVQDFIRNNMRRTRSN